MYRGRKWLETVGNCVWETATTSAKWIDVICECFLVNYIIGE